MRIRNAHKGLSLVEMLTALAIIIITIAIVIPVATRIHDESNINSAHATMQILNSALEEFADYGYHYSGEDYIHLKYPIDCDEMNMSDFSSEMKLALFDNDPSKTFSVTLDTTIREPQTPEDTGIEAVYFMLSLVPQSREILSRLDDSQLLSKGEITINSSNTYPLIAIVDPWGEVLNYSYYDNTVEDQPTLTQLEEPGMDNPRVFPVIRSAGPDGEFDTDDDITNLRD